MRSILALVVITASMCSHPALATQDCAKDIGIAGKHVRALQAALLPFQKTGLSLDAYRVAVSEAADRQTWVTFFRIEDKGKDFNVMLDSGTLKVLSSWSSTR